MTLLTLSDADARYPARVRQRLGANAPAQITALGNLGLLGLPMTALFCSTRSPGNVILATHDQAARWRDDGRCIISGFHSPIEKECLLILLRGNQPIIICPARGLVSMRVPADWKEPLAKSRLLVLSAFGSTEKRATRNLASDRNRIVAALADEVVFAHVTPGGHLDALRKVVANWSTPHRTIAGTSASNPI
jgi:predicted Rossmann fold nucleotide-binding protein DprA/Smf involved in DNA uptake